jgi:hypothetical protein
MSRRGVPRSEAGRCLSPFVSMSTEPAGRTPASAFAASTGGHHSVIQEGIMTQHDPGPMGSADFAKVCRFAQTDGRDRGYLGHHDEMAPVCLH